MTTSFVQIVDAIFDHLAECGQPTARLRRPGIQPDFVVAKVRALNLQSPAGLVRLYSVADGTTTLAGDPLDAIQFFPGFYWMNLDEAITTYCSVSGDKRWNKHWLPLFANGGGDFYAVICDQASPDFGAVVGFILGETDQIVEFESLSAMLLTIERSFAQRVFYQKSGTLEANWVEMRVIAKAVQPSFSEHDAA